LLARGQFVYLLADDDRIHFGGLRNAVSIMQGDPDIVAVFGGYEECMQSTNEIIPVGFVERRTDFAQGDKLGIFNKFSMLWCPVSRTDIINRYWSIDTRTLGMWNLVSSLVERGKVVAIPDLFYRHAQTEPRLEYELTENWYHDAFRAEYEIFIGRISSCDPDKLATFISQRVTKAYIQGARFAQIKDDFLAQRHFVLRARAYGLIPESEVMAWEKGALVGMIAQRLLARVELISTIDEIIFEASPRLQVLREWFGAIASKYSIVSMPGKEFLRQGLRSNQFLVTFTHGLFESGAATQYDSAFSVGVEDLIETCRVTDQPLALDIAGAAADQAGMAAARVS